MYCIPFKWEQVPRRAVSDVLMAFGSLPRGEVGEKAALVVQDDLLYLVTEFDYSDKRDWLMLVSHDFKSGQNQAYDVSKYDEVTEVVTLLMKTVPNKEREVYMKYNQFPYHFDSEIGPSNYSDGSAQAALAVSYLFLNRIEQVEDILSVEFDARRKAFIKRNRKGVIELITEDIIHSTLEEWMSTLMECYYKCTR